MIKEAANSDKTSGSAPGIVVVQGWFEEVKRRVPTN